VAVTAATALLPDRYAGAKRIGRGGMGEIYRATDTTLGRAVAIKLLDLRHAQDEGVRERFTREALAVARLSGNAHIVTIYDVGEWRGRPFIVMEYLPGGSLQETIETEGAQPPGRVLDWLEQAASALDAAHREGVVHRDVKPANLLLDRLGRVHVADFGIATATGLSSLTQTGTVLGTASYLSPEQAMGERATPASDLYGLGVVAFELLTGRRPFEGDSVAAEASAHVTGPIPSVCDVNPDVPCELDPVFERALAKHPRERYGSAAELVAALRGALDDAAGATRALPARPPTSPARSRGPRRRPAWLVPALAGLLLAGIGTGVGVAVSGGGGSGSDTKAVQPKAVQPKVSISVRTVTQPGTTVVTTAPATTASPPTTAPPPTTSLSGSDPYALNNQAYALMQQGDYEGALPLLQNAVGRLQGRSDLGTAYAEYNLGVTLINLGHCSDAIQYLEASRAIQPQRREVKDALKQARGCSG
jgi:eukaryotic-like serine/threonine-protein kinase